MIVARVTAARVLAWAPQGTPMDIMPSVTLRFDALGLFGTVSRAAPPSPPSSPPPAKRAQV